MGSFNSTPVPVPSAKDAKAISETHEMIKYTLQYNKCTRIMRDARLQGETSAMCEYVGPFYDELLKSQGYKTEWCDDDDYFGSNRFEVSWNPHL